MPGGDAALRLKNRIASVAAGRQPTLDDRFEALGREIPGFGGIYYDSSGRLNVLLRDSRHLEVARTKVATFLRLNSRSRVPSLRVDAVAGGLRSNPARYEFRVLLAWYRTFLIPATSENRGVVMSAIDHRANRIVIGVASQDLVDPILTTLSRLPVPRAAYEVAVFGAGKETVAFADTSVNEEFRPSIPGGVQIARSLTSTTEYVCSIGFNLKNWLNSSTTDTSQYFVTAAHCTSNVGSVNSDYMGQSDHFDPGGTEIIDPPFFTHTESANCPESAVCFLSDAAVFRYSNPAYSQQGKIAWPSTNNSLVVGGRLEVDGMADPVQGEPVYKVGRSTGRTFGNIEYPCVLLTKTDGRKFICQGLANYYSDEGDSGGPVFRLTSSTTATALGTTYYRYVTGLPWNQVWHGVFSPIGSIANYSYYPGGGYIFDPSLGTSAPFVPNPPSPPSYFASISGPDVVGPSMFCTWYSGTNVEDPSYEWFADGVSVGTDPSLVRVSSSGFLLELHVWNPVTGADRWDSMEITVDENAPSCQ